MRIRFKSAGETSPVTHFLGPLSCLGILKRSNLVSPTVASMSHFAHMDGLLNGEGKGFARVNSI
jgi:hypothetical protein